MNARQYTTESDAPAVSRLDCTERSRCVIASSTRHKHQVLQPVKDAFGDAPVRDPGRTSRPSRALQRRNEIRDTVDYQIGARLA
jgi:hypothetical protein